MQQSRFAWAEWLWLTKSTTAGIVSLLVATLLLAGCTGSSLKTHPVEGRVALKDGDVAILQGSHIELQHPSDESLRPSGVIDSSGAFSIKTLHQGEIVPGAPEGSYKARIVLADQSDEGVPKRKGNPVHPRFFDFDKSGLSFSVPAGDYSVSLSAK